MKTVLSIICVLGIVSPVAAQDVLLRVLVDRSPVIVHVKVLDVLGGDEGELGVQMWQAECRVIQLIKGELGGAKNLSLHFNVLANGGGTKKPTPERHIVLKDKEYILSLREPQAVRDPTPPNHTTQHCWLIDRWIGALAYDWYLVSGLKHTVAQETKRKKQ